MNNIYNQPEFSLGITWMDPLRMFVGYIVGPCGE